MKKSKQYENFNSEKENPSYYRSHPSGVECLDITRYMNFCLGNAIKYIWRCEKKGDKVGDLKKAMRYIEEEINNCDGVKGGYDKVTEEECDSRREAVNRSVEGYHEYEDSTIEMTDLRVSALEDIKFDSPLDNPDILFNCDNTPEIKFDGKDVDYVINLRCTEYRRGIFNWVISHIDRNREKLIELDRRVSALEKKSDENLVFG